MRAAWLGALRPRAASQEAKAELLKIDTDKDGKATLAEITAYMKAVSSPSRPSSARKADPSRPLPGQLVPVSPRPQRRNFAHFFPWQEFYGPEAIAEEKLSAEDVDKKVRLPADP